MLDRLPNDVMNNVILFLPGDAIHRLSIVSNAVRVNDGVWILVLARALRGPIVKSWCPDGPFGTTYISRLTEGVSTESFGLPSSAMQLYAQLFRRHMKCDVLEHNVEHSDLVIGLRAEISDLRNELDRSDDVRQVIEGDLETIQRITEEQEEELEVARETIQRLQKEREGESMYV